MVFIEAVQLKWSARKKKKKRWSEKHNSLCVCSQCEHCGASKARLLLKTATARAQFDQLCCSLTSRPLQWCSSHSICFLFLINWLTPQLPLIRPHRSFKYYNLTRKSVGLNIVSRGVFITEYYLSSWDFCWRRALYDVDVMCQSDLHPCFGFLYDVADTGDSVIVDDGDVVYSVHTPSWPREQVFVFFCAWDVIKENAVAFHAVLVFLTFSDFAVSVWWKTRVVQILKVCNTVKPSLVFSHRWSVCNTDKCFYI